MYAIAYIYIYILYIYIIYNINDHIHIIYSFICVLQCLCLFNAYACMDWRLLFQFFFNLFLRACRREPLFPEREYVYNKGEGIRLIEIREYRHLTRIVKGYPADNWLAAGWLHKVSAIQVYRHLMHAKRHCYSGV